MQRHPTAPTEITPQQTQGLLFATDYGRSKPTPAPPPPSNSTPTSQAAAESIRDAAPTLRMQCYDAICRAGSRGQTRHEVAEATGIALASVCPRISELFSRGLIVESGTRFSPSGRAAGVLIATQHRKES